MKNIIIDFDFFLHAVEHRYECAVTKNQILPTLHRNHIFCKECWKKCIGFNKCVLLNLTHSTILCPAPVIKHSAVTRCL